MTVSFRILAASSLLAFASMANAGGLDATDDEPDLIVVQEASSSSAPNPGFSLGSLGGGGAAVAAGILVVGVIAAAGGGSGSH